MQQDEDFIIRNIPDKTLNFDQNDDDTGIIYLSRIGFQMFLATAQKPMAKYFARQIFEIHDGMSKILKQVNIGVTHLSEKARALVDYEKAMKYLMSVQSKLEKDVNETNIDPLQLIFPFEKDETLKAISSAFDEAKRISLQVFFGSNDTTSYLQNQKSNGRLQLPQVSGKGCEA